MKISKWGTARRGGDTTGHSGSASIGRGKEWEDVMETILLPVLRLLLTSTLITLSTSVILGKNNRHIEVAK